MIQLHGECPRGRTDCEAYAAIESTCGGSFFCCGENDGTGRAIEGDKYTLCFKNGEVDEMSHNDRRDLTHQASVILRALSIIEEIEAAGELK